MRRPRCPDRLPRRCGETRAHADHDPGVDFLRGLRAEIGIAHGGAETMRDDRDTLDKLSVLGFRHVTAEHGWHRYEVAGGGSGRYIDVREMRDARRGAWGIGSIHHLAWRVDDEAHQHELREDIEHAGRRPTPVIDRFWFKSVYFLEPGGVLFELATDGPGFGVDEDLAHLGESLVLPPWLEPHRAAIESMLPPLTQPAPTAAS